MHSLRTFLLSVFTVACSSVSVDSPQSAAFAAAPPTNARAESGRLIATVVSDGCKMEVELPKEPAAGSPVRIRATITNTGKVPVLVTWETNEPLPFDLELKTGGGPVPLTRYGVKKIAPTDLLDQLQQLRGSIRQRKLEPGATKVLDLPNLALFYDLTVPGEYELTVSHSVEIGKGQSAKLVHLRAKGIRLTISNP